MKEKNNNSVGIWIAMTAGMLMFYLLSSGPVQVYYIRTHKKPSQWLNTFYSPLSMLIEKNKTVEDIYTAYLHALGV